MAFLTDDDPRVLQRIQQAQDRSAISLCERCYQIVGGELRSDQAQLDTAAATLRDPEPASEPQPVASSSAPEAPASQAGGRARRSLLATQPQQASSQQQQQQQAASSQPQAASSQPDQSGGAPEKGHAFLFRRGPADALSRRQAAAPRAPTAAAGPPAGTPQKRGGAGLT